jgi:hypothetical protein
LHFLFFLLVVSWIIARLRKHINADQRGVSYIGIKSGGYGIAVIRDEGRGGISGGTAVRQ